MSNRKRRDERRARAEQMRRERERAEARRARLITGAVVAVVLVVVVAAGAAIFASQRDHGVAPSGVTSKDGFVYSADTIGSKQATAAVDPVKLVFYEDFMCPICGQFESEVGNYVQEQVKAGAISVEYRPIAILDSQSTTSYSTRATAAGACVFEDAGAEGYHKFHDLLYDNQPQEGSAGLSDSQLADLANQAGAGSVSACIEGDDYEKWVGDATDLASQDNVHATPTVLLQGKELSNAQGGPPALQDLVNAVMSAQGKQGTSTPSNGPSATP